LFLYSLTDHLITKQSFLFPSSIINSESFLSVFGFPVQALRALIAAALALFVIRALRAFELERKQRLAVADQARRAAQQEAMEAQERARVETELLNRQLQAIVLDLSMLLDLSRSLSATLDPDDLLHKAIVKIVSRVPRIEAGMILLREKSNRPMQAVSHVAFCAETADTAAFLREARDVGQQVIATGKPAWDTGNGAVLVHEMEKPPRSQNRGQPVPETGGHVAGVPLVMQDQVVGSLVLAVGPEAMALTTKDLSLLSIVASQLSMAIQNATLYREVQAREALRGELLHEIVAAQERERQRIARELHDGAGQMLTALGLGLATANECLKSDPALAARRLAEVKSLSAEALQELHDVITGLRPSVLYDLGLVPALRGQAQEFQLRTGVHAQVVVSGRRRRVKPEIETVVFRIAQETLTNAAKHAAAQNVMIRLVFRQDALQLSVQDDGSGFDVHEALSLSSGRRHAWGLLGMQERVALVNGSCQITSRPGVGTTIQVDIPIDRVAEEVSVDDQVDSSR
jgi:signal transduction histidine kinase